MRLLFLFFLLLLTGCTHLSWLPSHPLWETHHTHLKAIETWDIQGSIAIATEKDTWNARVYWRQEGSTYQLRFNAPLGQGAMVLNGHDQGVTMKTAKNETFVAKDPDALIRQTLKLEIPVSGLYYWIRGIPTLAAILKYDFTPQGYLHTLQQNDWYIEYAEYLKVGEFELPKKIFLSHTPFEVKIVISQWKLGSRREQREVKTSDSSLLP